MPVEVELNTLFLNVDLDLVSHSSDDLDRLLVKFSAGADIIHREPCFAILELEHTRANDLASTLSGLLGLIESLDEPSRRIWEKLAARRLDIGVRAGLTLERSTYAVSPALLRHLAAAHVELIFTLYGPISYQAGDGGKVMDIAKSLGAAK